MFSVLVIRLRSLRLLRVSGIVMRLRMFLLLITFLKASHSFRNRLLEIGRASCRERVELSGVAVVVFRKAVVTVCRVTAWDGSAILAGVVEREVCSAFAGE